MSAPLAPTEAPRAGRGVTIAGFVFAFVFPLLGLILSIVGLVQARGAGQKNGLAIAGIIVSVVWPTILAISIVALTAAACSSGVATCTTS